MRVAIDATHLGSGKGGDETYMRGLLTGLGEVVSDDGEHTFPLYLRPGAAAPEAVAGRSAFPVRRMPWGPVGFRHAIGVPLLVRRERPPVDLVHTVLYGPPLSPVPHVLYLGDISFYRHPEYYPMGTRLRLNLIIPFLVRRARAVITLSEYSRRDMVEAFGVPADRVFVVPAAVMVSDPLDSADRVAPSPQPSLRGGGGTALRLSLWERSARSATADEPGDGGPHGGRCRLPAAPYFLYLGNLHPRKNVFRLIQAFIRARQACPALAGHTLIIAGAHWYADTEEESMARGAPPGSVQFLGPVDEPTRDHLLSGAQALAFPSLFEGFGLPPVEAMAVGTPVLASNATSLPEVLGDAALLVDPLDVEAMAQGLVRMGTDPALRQELRRRGFDRAATYTTRATGERALEAFRQAGL